MLSDLMARQVKATGKPYSLADFDSLDLCVSAAACRGDAHIVATVDRRTLADQ